MKEENIKGEYQRKVDKPAYYTARLLPDRWCGYEYSGDAGRMGDLERGK